MNWIKSNVHPLKGTKDAPEEYIVVVEGATASTALYWDGDMWHDEEFTPHAVSHWMPLPEPPKEVRMNRSEILKKANECVTGSRAQDYGEAEDNFALIAALWEPYIKSRCVLPDTEVTILPQDVAILMSLLKIARIATGTQTDDSFVDACGYLACAGEIAGKDTNVPTKEEV